MVCGIQVNEFFWKKLFSMQSCEACRSLTNWGRSEVGCLGTDCFAKETELNLALTEKY